MPFQKHLCTTFSRTRMRIVTTSTTTEGRIVLWGGKGYRVKFQYDFLDNVSRFVLSINQVDNTFVVEDVIRGPTGDLARKPENPKFPRA
eukprot:3594777-Pyramimonas_sp.AAC.2